MKELKKFTVNIYFMLVFLIMPFFADKAYFNMLEAKAYIVDLALTWLLLVIVILAGYSVCKKISEKEKVCKDSFKNIIKRLDILDWFVMMFGISVLLSWLTSKYFKSAFWGSQGWSVGAYILILLCVSYFIISRIVKPSEWMIYVMMVGMGATFFIAILNCVCIDPFGFQEQLMTRDLHKYLAGIGNINTYAGLLSMIIPCTVGISLNFEDLRKKTIIYVFLVLGYMNVLISNSDGVYLGLAAGAVILIYHYIINKDGLRDLLINGLLFFAACGLVEILDIALPDRIVKLEGISGTIIYGRVWILIGVISSILILLNMLIGKNGNEDKKIYKRRIVVVTAGVLLIYVTYLFVHNFCDSWGNNRGQIWRYSIQTFANVRIDKKIFGIGPDCYGIAIMDRFRVEIERKWGKPVVNAHNEWLQYLITLGITGCIAYAGVWFSVIKKTLENSKFKQGIKSNGLSTALAAGIIGYAGQALVNNPQAYNLAVLFLLLALFRNVYGKSIGGMQREQDSK